MKVNFNADVKVKVKFKIKAKSLKNQFQNYITDFKKVKKKS